MKNTIAVAWQESNAKEQERIDNYEEERRLFYVAITRAKNELHLFNVSECESSFVNEVAPPVKTAKAPLKHQPDVQIIEPQVEKHSDLQVQAPSVTIAPDLAAYTVNTRVKHATYGEGIISGIERKRDDIHVIDVRFNDGSKSKLHLEVVVRMGLLHLAYIWYNKTEHFPWESVPSGGVTVSLS